MVEDCRRMTKTYWPCRRLHPVSFRILLVDIVRREIPIERSCENTWWFQYNQDTYFFYSYLLFSSTSTSVKPIQSTSYNTTIFWQNSFIQFIVRPSLYLISFSNKNIIRPSSRTCISITILRFLLPCFFLVASGHEARKLSSTKMASAISSCRLRGMQIFCYYLRSV